MLARPHRGVYVVNWLRTPDTARCVAIAAVPDAVVSRQTAASLLGFPIGDDGVVHLTVRKGGSRRLDGVIVHEARSLPVRARRPVGC